MPEGMREEWIYADPDTPQMPMGERVFRYGPMAFFGAGKGLGPGKTRPLTKDEQVANRLSIAQAQREMAQAGQVSPETQLRLMELQQDAYEFDQTRADKQKAQAAGGTGDIGTAGRREAADRKRQLDTGFQGLAAIEDLYAEAEKEGAIGPGVFEGSGPGKFFDRVGAMFGNKGSEKDLSLRNRTNALSMEKIMDVLMRFVGPTTDFEFEKAALTVPAENAPDEERRRFVETLKDQAATALYASGEAPTVEDARRMVDDRIRMYREGLDPNSQMNPYMGGGGEDPLEKYAP
jgi:hypothetical protein